MTDDFPSSSCTAWEDCNHDGVCHDPVGCGAIGPNQRVDCERCQGNGEIITDWNRYLHGQPGDKGDEGTADCPDCFGTGFVKGNAA